MCYTSGTTGRAKGVVYSHRSTVLHTGRLPGRPLGLKGTDVLLPVGADFHSNSWGTPYAAVMLGMKVVFPARPACRRPARPDPAEPPTLAWACRRSGSALSRPTKVRCPTAVAGSCRGLRSLVGGAAVPESLIPLSTDTVSVAAGWGIPKVARWHRVVPARRAQGRRPDENVTAVPRCRYRRRWSNCAACRRRQRRRP